MRYREELGLTGSVNARSGSAPPTIRERGAQGDRPDRPARRRPACSGARSPARRGRPELPRALVGVGASPEPSGRQRTRRAGTDQGVGVASDRARCPLAASGAAGPVVGRRDRTASFASERHGRRGLDGLIPELERSGDDLGLTKAWQLVAEQAWSAGKVEAMREPLARALVHARLAGDRLEENEVVVSMLFVDRAGPAKPRDMLARYAEVAAEGADDRRFEAEVLGCEAVAHAMLGEFELARSLLGRYGEIIRDLGIILRGVLARRDDLVRRDARRRRGRGGGRDPDRRGERCGAVGRAGRSRGRIPAGPFALRAGPGRGGGGELAGSQEDLGERSARGSSGCPRAPKSKRGGRTPTWLWPMRERPWRSPRPRTTSTSTVTP